MRQAEREPYRTRCRPEPSAPGEEWVLCIWPRAYSLRGRCTTVHKRRQGGQELVSEQYDNGTRTGLIRLRAEYRRLLPFGDVLRRREARIDPAAPGAVRQ